ncbi:hypothetical protein SUDANB15_06294 [Streptomyces sp. enrichment culture]|uniref:hypothetical protein n=1 Tax=Streptomyces sp. enrichment culture TaxID=1795815 RepID=UPI003F577875
MPGWMDLVYTTAGGVVGAAVTTYLSMNQERRQLRASVMQQLLRVAAVREGVCDIVPGRRGSPSRHPAGARLLATARCGVTAVLEDGRDAEHAQREAVSDLVVAALSAGVPRRVLDFAGGSEERALQCEVIQVIDLRLGGVLGDSLEELMTRCEEYRQATVQHLLLALWHPWQARLRTGVRLRALRRDVAALHRAQEAALSVLARPEHVGALAERIGRLPDRGPRRVDGPGPPAWSAPRGVDRIRRATSFRGTRRRPPAPGLRAGHRARAFPVPPSAGRKGALPSRVALPDDATTHDGREPQRCRT